MGMTPEYHTVVISENMGQIYLFFSVPTIRFEEYPRYNQPNILVPWEVDKVPKLGDPPVGRDEVLEYFSQMYMKGAWDRILGRKYVVRRDTTQYPWQAWNFTKPCMPEKYTSIERVRKSLEMTMAVPIDTVEIKYGDHNTAGILTSTVHPDSVFPAVGDFVTAMWGEDDDDGTKNSKKKDVHGYQMFHGRITKVGQTPYAIKFEAVDALGPLMDTGQVSVGKMTPDRAAYQIAGHAGACLYLSDDWYSAVRRIPQIPVTRTYSGTYLSSIVDLLDRWYMETGARHFLTAQGGLIEVCDYDNFTELDVIDARMMKSWSFEQNTDHTYTRAYIDYPVVDADGKTTKKVYRDRARYMVFRHSQYHTFRYTAESEMEAMQMAHFVLTNHSAPTYQISMTDVVGIPHLRPGMHVAVPIEILPAKGDNKPEKIVAVSRIRSISHKFRTDNTYTMDIVAECNPYHEIYDDVGTNFLRDDPAKTHGFYTRSAWNRGIAVTYFENEKPYPVRAKYDSEIVRRRVVYWADRGRIRTRTKKEYYPPKPKQEADAK